jgi:hypothetical protein
VRSPLRERHYSMAPASVAGRQSTIGPRRREPTSRHRPATRPSVDNCRYCAVRHLCDEYWQEIPAAVEPDFTDLQIAVVGRHGPSSWDGIIERSFRKDTAESIVLRTPATSELVFTKGDCIRVLDVHVSTVDEGNVPIVASMSSMSEDPVRWGKPDALFLNSEASSSH